MGIIDLLQSAVQQGAADIFLISNFEPAFRIQSEIIRIGANVLKPEQVEVLICEIYKLAKGRSMEKLLQTGDDDFSFSVPGLGRFRTNAAVQRGTLTVVIRVVSFTVPNYKELNIPQKVMELASLVKGLVLIAGAAGNGKTTSLACLIDKINSERACHIVTMEDPIEYLHRHKKSIVTQREIGVDTENYASGLRAALRQSPDVILIGEMRDFETMDIAMSAAESGQLVFSTLHTTGTANTIDRIVDSFPENRQQQIRLQLSMVLQAVVSQQLIPGKNGELFPVFEILLATPAVRNMIREAKTHQMDSVIFSGSKIGMQSMDTAIFELYREKKISAENAVMYSLHPDEMQQKINKQ